MRLTRRFIPILFVSTFLFLPLQSSAEQWSLEQSQEHPPEKPQNRIIKWCSEDGSQERWASANIQPKGYIPCGKLSTVATCGASGKRMIGGNDSERPRDHRDCGVGPRILIVNHDENDTIDTSAVPENPGEITPLSNDEAKALKQEIEHAEKLQNSDPMMQLQKMADLLLQQLLSGPGGKPKSDRELDKKLKNVDPKTRSAIKQLLKQYGP